MYDSSAAIGRLVAILHEMTHLVTLIAHIHTQSAFLSFGRMQVATLRALRPPLLSKSLGLESIFYIIPPLIWRK
jgi:hypothetical protein